MSIIDLLAYKLCKRFPFAFFDSIYILESIYDSNLFLDCLERRVIFKVKAKTRIEAQLYIEYLKNSTTPTLKSYTPKSGVVLLGKYMQIGNVLSSEKEKEYLDEAKSLL